MNCYMIVSRSVWKFWLEHCNKIFKTTKQLPESFRSFSILMAKLWNVCCRLHWLALHVRSLLGGGPERHLDTGSLQWRFGPLGFRGKVLHLVVAALRYRIWPESRPEIDREGERELEEEQLGQRWEQSSGEDLEICWSYNWHLGSNTKFCKVTFRGKSFLLLRYLPRISRSIVFLNKLAISSEICNWL